ncbi:MAG: MFS transporter [Nitrospinota bacterium]
MRERWLIALSAGLISMVGFGSRGVFGIFYVEMLKEFPWDRASLAGAYSVGMLLMGFGGALAGNLSRRLGPKRFYLMSGILVGLTFFLASRVQTLAQVYLTYGLLGGISLAALGFGPTQGLVVRWFETRRGLALGLVTAGAGAYPLLAPFAQLLVESIGWRRGLIALGALFFALVTVLGTAVMREPPPEVDAQPGGRPTGPSSPPREAWTLKEALKTGPIWMITLAWFFMAITIHFVNAHLVALVVETGHSALLASGVLALAGVFSLLNRAVAGGVSDYLGRVPTFITGAITTGLGFLILLLPQTAGALWGLYAFAILFGLGTGAQTAQPAALASDVYRGPYFGSIVGFLTLGFGLGGGLGPWLGGLVFEWTGSYRIMIGCVLLALSCSSACIFTADRGIRKLKGRVP